MVTLGVTTSVKTVWIDLSCMYVVVISGAIIVSRGSVTDVTQT